jgi:hypothetical protein
MPNLPNPSEPGQPGVRGREAETERESGTSDQGGVDRTQPEPQRARGDEKPMTGRQPAHPGQPGRYHDKVGQRDEPGKR